MEKNKTRTGIMFTALALMVFLTGPAKVNAGCVGASQTFEFGDTVTESCTFDGDMVRPSGVTGHGLIAGADDITIDGNGYCLDGDVKSCVGGETNDAGIESVCHSNVTIKNLEVKNFCHGIEMKGCGPNDVTNNTIECCVVHDNGEPGGDVPGAQTQGIKWNNLSNSLITNCKIYNQLGDPAASGPPGGFGIYLCGGDDNEWCHNEVYDNAKAGLFLRCSPWRAWLHHNYLHDNPFAGIRAQCVNDKDFLVEYNYCVNNNGDDGGYGIFFGGAASDPNCVRYNVCKWNRVGIAFERESWCGHLYENTACENEAWDIYVQDYAVVTGDCNICGNTYNYNDTSATSGCLYACGDEPAAGFTSELTDPLTIAFTDTSVPGNQGDPIDSYYWDFGDCSVPGTSTDQNPTHVYDEPGTYTVCFSVTDDKACPNGCPCDPPPPGAPGVTEGGRDTICQEVTVYAADEDGDSIPDGEDNCRLTPNPGQEDTNDDGYGNICDCDLDNNDAVGPSDFGQFRSAWGSTPGDGNWNPDADFDSDNAVGQSDFDIFKSRWFTSAPYE